MRAAGWAWPQQTFAKNLGGRGPCAGHKPGGEPGLVSITAPWLIWYKEPVRAVAMGRATTRNRRPTTFSSPFGRLSSTFHKIWPGAGITTSIWIYLTALHVQDGARSGGLAGSASALWSRRCGIASSQAVMTGRVAACARRIDSGRAWGSRSPRHRGRVLSTWSHSAPERRLPGSCGQDSCRRSRTTTFSARRPGST
jgi:hypothetical protein